MSSRSGRRKVGIFHAMLGGGDGGAESAALWTIEALKHECDLTLITALPIQLDSLNEYYGTRVTSQDFSLRVVRIPEVAWRLKRLVPRIGGPIVSSIFERACQRMAPEFDVPISTVNPLDFGVPGIHKLADLSWDARLRDEVRLASGASRTSRAWKAPRRVYERVMGSVRRASGRDLLAGDDIILANSNWSAETIERCLKPRGVRVVHPPVWGHYPAVPLESREPGFVCLGRISPEKKIDRIIDILARVRSRGHDVRLHVVGRMDGSPYARRIGALCERHSAWARATGALVGSRKQDLLSRQTFGIHARLEEAFGIAVAEMCKAGCIPFVFHQGGPAEIVDHPALCYENIEDAVQKIDRVLRDQPFRQSLHAHIARRSEHFSAEVFMRGIHDAVESFEQMHGGKASRVAA